MLKHRNLLTGMITFFLLSACTSPKKELEGRVFRNFNILTLENERILRDHVLVLQGDSISHLLPEEEFSQKYVFHDSLVIDGNGKYIMPSFHEMHAHFQPRNPNHKEYLKHYLGYGITDIRVMAGSEQLLSWKDSIQTGLLLGPSLKVAGPLIDGEKPLWGRNHDGPIVVNPNKIDSIITSHKAKGYDLIKLYERLSKEVYLEFLQSAKENDIRVAGHIPFAFLSKPNIEEVFTSISPSFEHFKNFGPFVTKEKIEEVDQPEDLDYYGYSLADNPDIRKISKVVSRIKEQGIWTCPTHVLWRNNADSILINNLTKSRPFQKIDSGLKNWWLSTKRYGKKDTEVNNLSRLFLQEMSRQNVKILAGTDFPNPFLVPGYSLHQEIHSFVEMGYSNLEALKSATIYPAEYWGQMDRRGYLQKGRIGNLIILKGNPLEEIKNTLSIDQVIYKGEILNPQELIKGL